MGVKLLVNFFRFVIEKFASTGFYCKKEIFSFKIRLLLNTFILSNVALEMTRRCESWI